MNPFYVFLTYESFLNLVRGGVCYEAKSREVMSPNQV